MYKQFAASGSCHDKEEIIFGRVENQITFTSDEFTGTMNSQKFWDDLAAFARRKNRYIVLVYR